MLPIATTAAAAATPTTTSTTTTSTSTTATEATTQRYAIDDDGRSANIGRESCASGYADDV